MFWQWFAACSSGTRSTTRLNRRWHVRDRKTRRHPRTIRNKLSEERGRTFEPNYRSFRPLQTKCSTALTALAVHQGDKQTRRLSLASLPSFSDAFSFFLQWTTILFPRTNANYRTAEAKFRSFSHRGVRNMVWSHSHYSVSFTLQLCIFLTFPPSTSLLRLMYSAAATLRSHIASHSVTWRF